MPRGPKGEKRPADVVGNAIHVMRIATGEIEETLPPAETLPSKATENGLGQLYGCLGTKKGPLQKKQRDHGPKAVDGKRPWPILCSGPTYNCA
jgi:hypothetical protein